MRHLKWLALLFLLSIIFSLSACGESLKKPTGLEAENNTEQEKEDDVNDNILSDLQDNRSKEPNQTDDKINKSNDNEKDNSDTDTDSENNESANSSDTEANQSTLESNTEGVENSEDQGNQETESKPNQEKTKQDESNPNKKKSDKQSKGSKNKKGQDSDQSLNDQSDGNNKGESNEEEKDQINIITHSIVISSNEVPLSPTEYEVQEEESVLEALITATQDKGIHMDYRGGRGATAYVRGMGNVYEFDRGQGSGWMYSVNGVFPDRGAGVVPLCDGDVVEWLYTTNLGDDLDADLEPFRRDGKCP